MELKSRPTEVRKSLDRGDQENIWTSRRMNQQTCRQVSWDYSVWGTEGKKYKKGLSLRDTYGTPSTLLMYA